MDTIATDRIVLRELAHAYAEAAALPVHREKADLWRKLNRLEPVRPLVYMKEIPWHEMNVNDELTERCTDPYARQVETWLRQTLYQWRHMPCDMVLDQALYVDYVCAPVGVYADYGIYENAALPDGEGAVSFIPIIQTDADIAKIQMPRVTMDWAETERRFQFLHEVCDGILPVVKRGIVHQWFTPWDMLIRWYGIEQLFLDMVDRPAFVHRLLEHFMTISHAVLDQQEAMGLLSAGNGNYTVGSGGLGITDELPAADCNPSRIRLRDQWGCSTGQIFSEVSPAMHEEFCLQYERPYLERFGLTYYGCCEPLHKKMEILRSVKNLRKISMSYWIDIDIAADELGADYVFSYKPTPSVFAWDRWDPQAARDNLETVLEKTRGNRVELIMKDISTVRDEPQRLWAWATMAMEIVEAL